jgi:transcriptional regulator with XRE-family HTH domain
VQRSPTLPPSPDPAAADPAAWIGAEVRSLRRAKGLSLHQLATRCGKSVGFLSQLERGLSRPTVSVLHDLATALGVQIHWFFPASGIPAASDAGIVVRQAQRRRLSFASGISDYLLSPNLDGPLELLWSVMEPLAESGETSYQHPGDEAGVVIRGTLELWVDGKFFQLQAGDSFSFQSSRPHRYRNPGPDITEITWVVTPPSY